MLTGLLMKFLYTTGLSLLMKLKRFHKEEKIQQMLEIYQLWGVRKLFREILFVPIFRPISS
jgi:hypothetical protein